MRVGRMTESRNCRYSKCRKPLPSTHRPDAKFCDELCRSRHKNEARRQAASDTRVNRSSASVGSRGGNVRSVQEARILQSESKEKDRWRLIMEQQVLRTLLETGAFHVDDLDPLDLPPVASEVKGTLVSSVRARGYMESTEVRRKVAHAAANARKAPIYRISAKGRRELPKLLIDLQAKLAGVGATGVVGADPGVTRSTSDSGKESEWGGNSPGSPDNAGSEDGASSLGSSEPAPDSSVPSMFDADDHLDWGEKAA